MKSTYFTIHPGKNPPPQNGCGWHLLVFCKHRFHILHFPNSTGLFTKPTGRHYTTYRFSPDIDLGPPTHVSILNLECCLYIFCMYANLMLPHDMCVSGFLKLKSTNPIHFKRFVQGMDIYSQKPLHGFMTCQRSNLAFNHMDVISEWFVIAFFKCKKHLNFDNLSSQVLSTS